MRVICVTGMHRSGTSLVARVINLLGVDLGPPDQHMRAGPDNPTGFWENRPLSKINDAVLARLGGRWDDPGIPPDGWEHDAGLDDLRASAAAQLTLTFGEAPLVGFKDPRASLTLPFWRTVAPVEATVLCIRDPADVAASLRRRNGFDSEHAARLWLRYTCSALSADPHAHVVDYGDFFADLGSCVDALAKALDLPAPDAAARAAVAEFTDPDLRHGGQPPPEAGSQQGLAAAAYHLAREGQLPTLVAVARALVASWAQEEQIVAAARDSVRGLAAERDRLRDTAEEQARRSETQAQRQAATIAWLQSKLEGQRRDAERKLEQVYDSETWRVGHALVSGPRVVRDTARRVRAGQVTLPRPKALRARLRRPRRVDPRLVARFELDDDHDARTAYEAALARRVFTAGAATRVAMAVSTLDLDAGRGDLFTAVGLGRALEQAGLQVVYLDPSQWYDPPQGTEVFVSLLAEARLAVDPLRLPSDCVLVAWVRNLASRWATMPTLGLYDGVLCSSALSAAEVRRSYPGPVQLLPIGVDPQVFVAADSTSRRAAVATVNAWGSERGLYRDLRQQPPDFPLAMYGRQQGVPPELRPFAHGPVPFFSLPSLYRQAAVVLDDVQDVNRAHGTLNSRIYESLACGALPITNSRVGLAELGLSEVPSAADGATLRAQVHRWLDDESARAQQVDRLRQVVSDRHTYTDRAERFRAFVAPLLTSRPGQRPGPAPRVAPATVIGFTPDYRATNPYQRMLYRRATEAGVAAVACDDPVMMTIRCARRGQRFVFHVHWTATILGPARSHIEAEERCDRFLGDLDRVRERGGKVVWTMHNVVPHECAYPQVETRLAQGLADRAHAVHIMCDATVAEAERHFTLPADRVHVIPHGSYVDVYPNVVSPARARAALGLGAQDMVWLFLGGIRPYKGLEDLLDAFDAVSARKPATRLVVAGRPGRFPGVVDLQRRCETTRGIVASFGEVGDTDLQTYLNACDIVVLPHRQVLNSGGLLLGLSFGRPVVAPRTGCLTGLLDPAYSRVFEPDERDLAGVLERAETLRGDAARRAAFERAASFDADAMSARFFELVARIA